MRIPSETFSKPANGFTLLELVLALLIMALLVGMVFTTARSSLALGNTIVKSQNEEMLHQAFFTFLENRFVSLPRNTVFDLQVTKSAGGNSSDLTLENIPINFSWGNEKTLAKAIQISTVKNRSGYLDIVLKYYANEIITRNSNKRSGSTTIPEAPFAEIILLKDVRFFEWSVLNQKTMKFQNEWIPQNRLPQQLKIICAFGSDSDPKQHTLWIPRLENPDLAISQMQQNGGISSNNSGGGSLQKTAPIEINISPALIPKE